MQERSKNTQQAIEIFLRLSLIIGIIYWCFQILSPFLLPILWGAIIAVALFPLQSFIQPRLWNNQKLTAIVLTVLLLAIILVPATVMVNSIADSIIVLKNQIADGSIILPTPSESIKSWPIIGVRLYTFLISITEHTEVVFQEYQSQLVSVAKTVLQGVLGTGLGILQILLSVIIAGVFLATKGIEAASHKIANRMIEKQGEAFVELTTSTIRNVVKGVLGVAVIQSVLAGAGLYLAQIPHAGILVLASLIFTIIQIGPGVVLLPTIVYLFNTAEPVTAVLWTIYFVVVMFSDNILKPILLGKGAQVPMLVIFLGVVGGFILLGFIGLFTGAIVLSIGYKLYLAWLNVDIP
jgi:predicted PurR-regulated permease PerM